MSRTFKTILLLIFISTLSYAQKAGTANLQNYDQKMQWWREAKFGLFIHWGPYSLYGGKYHGYSQRKGGAEWIMNRCKIPLREYRAMASTFNPTKFNADEIVRFASENGMKYIVFTTKHHDGFAMFKSKASNFNIVDYTPFGRDVVAELANACRKYQMKLGFYYSQSQDWCHPGGATARKLMNEGWSNPDSTEIDAYTANHAGAWDYLQTTAGFNDYLQQIAIPQIKELLENYGDVSIVWWDTPMGITDEQASLIRAELNKYPQIITNDRLKRPNFPGDYKTPEGLIPKQKDVMNIDWETCMNIGSSWGFRSGEKNWKSPEILIRNLITIVARGGNYLLNVGPDPEGQIPAEAKNRISSMGEWLKKYGEAIYGAQRTDFHPSWGECTRKDINGKTVLYLNVFKWPVDGKLVLDADLNVADIRMLSGNSQLKYKKTDRKVLIYTDSQPENEIATVIKLTLRNKLAPLKIVSNTERFFEIVDEKH